MGFIRPLGLYALRRAGDRRDLRVCAAVPVELLVEPEAILPVARMPDVLVVALAAEQPALRWVAGTVAVLHLIGPAREAQLLTPDREVVAAVTARDPALDVAVLDDGVDAGVAVVLNLLTFRVLLVG